MSKDAFTQKAKIGAAYIGGGIAAFAVVFEFLLPYAGEALVNITQVANKPLLDSIATLSGQVKDIQSRDGNFAILENIDVRLSSLEADMALVKAGTVQNAKSIEALEADIAKGFFAIRKGQVTSGGFAIK